MFEKRNNSVISDDAGKAAAKRSLRATHRTVVSLAVAALLVALVVALSYWAFKQLESAAAARKQSYVFIQRADALLSKLKDAEIGQGGYALTGDESFLEPYLRARENINGDLKELHQFTVSSAARKHLDTTAPLVDAKLAEMSRVIELRRRQDITAVIALVSSGHGKRLMDSIRSEMSSFIQIAEDALVQHEAAFQSNMRQLFAIIITASLLAFLFALSFAYLIYRETQHRLKNLIHVETQHLLEGQEETNKQLRQTNVTLHASEEKLAVTLNSIGDAVIATDSEGRVTLMNLLAERLTGWTQAEAAKRPVDEIVHIINAKTRQPSNMPMKETSAHDTIQGLTNHSLLIARDGSECNIADSYAPIRDRDGQVVGTVLVFRDVTERERLYQMLQERNVTMEGAKSVAEKANLAKSEFLSSMSHELRTPLHAILGFAQLMEAGSPPPTTSQKGKIDQIVKAGWYLLDLINEILDLALIESGKLSLSMEPVSLAEVLLECQAMIEPQAQTRDVRVIFPQLERSYFVKADRTRVKQVLVNLLSNAIKYNKAGGTVLVDCIVSTAERMRICVKDSGEGLTADKLTQLFQPFNRLGQESNAEEGTGIGLVVSKQLVELMGGEIGVESTVGVGSVFWIELNLTAEPQPAAAAQPTVVAPAQVQGDAQLCTLLYVEDNPANLMLVEDIIARRPDMRLLSAVDGNRGIEMARAYLPDVILMDINLPGISGIQALSTLAQDPATAHIPVVALSANAMPHDIEKGLQAGFFRYLTKPIKINEFMDALDVALKFAQTQAPRANKGKHDY